MRRSGPAVSLGLLASLALPASLPAQSCVACAGTLLDVGMCPTTDIVHTGTGCGGLQLCQVPTFSEPSVSILPGSTQGTFLARLTVTVTAPWNQAFAASLPTGTLDMTWFDVSPATPTAR